MTSMTRSNAIAAADKILKQRSFSKEDKARAETLITYATALPPDDAGDVRQRVAELAQERQTSQDFNNAFNRYLVSGEEGCSMRELQLLQQRQAEKRDMTSGAGNYPGSPSGYLTSTLFEAEVWMALQQYDRLFDDNVVSWFTSGRGGPWQIPMDNDLAASAVIVSQDTASPPVDLGPLGQVSFPTAPTWRSGALRASVELDQDSAIALPKFLSEAFAKRFARGIGASFVAALVASSASSGQTVIGDDSQTSPNPTSQVGYRDLLNLIESVDPAHGANPGAGWVCNFSTLISLLALRDKQNRPMLPVAHNDKGDFLIFERPVFLCPSMQSMGAGNIPLMYGDLKRFCARRVLGSLWLLRSQERYLEMGQVLFEGYVRCNGVLAVDGNVASPSYPILYLQQP
jgi:HK97 family phage major capsid protein